MRNKIGTACIVFGTVLILAALSLFLWNRNDDIRAGKAADSVLPQLIDKLIADSDTASGGSDYPDPYDPTMTEVEIDGYAYIGYLSIPSISLELPVMSDWDYTRMKIAPCRYFGSTKTDDLVIAAHNYTRHFGRLSNLSVGDEVYFTDMDGLKRCYTVTVMETLSATAVEDMTAGEYALTLFTCNYGGQARIVIRCDKDV